MKKIAALFVAFAFALNIASAQAAENDRAESALQLLMVEVNPTEAVIMEGNEVEAQLKIIVKNASTEFELHLVGIVVNEEERYEIGDLPPGCALEMEIPKTITETTTWEIRAEGWQVLPYWVGGLWLVGHEDVKSITSEVKVECEVKVPDNQFMFSRFFYDILHYYKDFWKAIEVWYQEKQLYGW